MSEPICAECQLPIALPFGLHHWLHAKTSYCYGANHTFDPRGCEGLKCCKNENGHSMCLHCGKPVIHVRDLTGPCIRNGKFEVWTHTDSGFAPCVGTENGVEMFPSKFYATPMPTAQFGPSNIEANWNRLERP